VIDEGKIAQWISEIEELSLKLEYETGNLTEEQPGFYTG
jgi:hypothetical protein